MHFPPITIEGGAPPPGGPTLSSRLPDLSTFEASGEASGLLDREEFMNRRTFLHGLSTVLVGSAIGSLFPRLALSHHGWGWATGEEFELTGVIKAVKLGNPHGEMILDAKGDFAGEEWEVEIGQPWRNERAGLTEATLAIGTEVTAHGHRSANPDVKLMKAEWLMIGGVKHDLYPDRAS